MTTQDLAGQKEDLHPLDDPIRESLLGVHAEFARSVGNIFRFDPEVAGFIGHPPVLQDEDWPAIAKLFGPDTVVSLRGFGHVIPDGWEVLDQFGLVQLDGSGLETRPSPEAVVLTKDDVPEILDLIGRTKPGPFLARTIELGTYLGIREGGALVAMAGERMHPPGWTEISAVCTDPAHRGKGLATELVRAVGHGIRARGETPFLHAAATNTSAIRLYLSLGFELRKESQLTLVKTPSH